MYNNALGLLYHLDLLPTTTTVAVATWCTGLSAEKDLEMRFPSLHLCSTFTITNTSFHTPSFEFSI